MSEYYLTRAYGASDLSDFSQVLNQTLYTNGTAHQRARWFYGNRAQVFTLKHNKVDGPIGSLGFAIRDFKTPCGLKTGALAADFSVLKEHRNVQAAMQLMTEGVEEVLGSHVDFIYTIPNRESKALIKRTKLFQSVGKFTRHVKMISLGEAMGDSPLRYARPVADFAWKTAMRLVTFRQGSGLCVERSFDGIDQTWYSQKDPNVTMAIREAGYMHWRYMDSPDKGFYAFGIKERNQKAVLVYKVIKNRAYVVDLLYPEGDENMLVKLFAAFEEECRQEQYSMIVLQHLGADEAVNTLKKRLWYRPYKDTNKELLVASDDQDLVQCLVNSKQYWFAGDEDEI